MDIFTLNPPVCHLRNWMFSYRSRKSYVLQTALPYCKRLARHFEAAKQFAEAEKFFVRAKLANEAVEMYIRANKWDAVHKVISVFQHLVYIFPDL